MEHTLEWQFYIAAPLILLTPRSKVGRFAIIMGCLILGLAGSHISPAFLGSLISLFMLGITSYHQMRALI